MENNKIINETLLNNENKIIIETLKDKYLLIGKYKGLKFIEVLKKDFSYCLWVSKLKEIYCFNFREFKNFIDLVINNEELKKNYLKS